MPHIFDYLSKLYISLPHIGLLDIIDISTVFFILIKILSWIRNTRTWTILKGVVFVLSVAFIAYVFELNTLWWIISKTLTFGTIALIMVFQPELRLALEQLGRTSNFISPLLNTVFSNRTNEFTNADVTAIVDACLLMSKDKTGALIVIEKDVSLKDIEKTGISIGAIISKQLLVNIFEKNTPLHDGAVLIRNARIVSATCILPLSSNYDLSKDLGTRHRAAVGISEASDAVIIVVSEENGIISLISNGQIIRNIDSLSLSMALKEIFEENTVPKITSWKERIYAKK